MDPVTVTIGIALIFGVLFLHWQLKPKLIKLNQGSALVRHRMKSLPGGGTSVSFTSNYAIKLLDRVEIVDITAKNLRFEVRGNTADDMKISVNADFILKLPSKEVNVLCALDQLDPSAIASVDSLMELFETRFREVTKSVAATMTAEELRFKRDDFRDEVLNKIGRDLHGFCLDAAFIDLSYR